ncbi:MAG: hypothetical protein EOO44_11540 [Flavobacterium sp.]|nr:MAG: hypothetical protein EOO44_11540 [Flavobacterium sp.]
MNRIITICLFAFTFFSCDSDEKDQIITGYVIDTSLNISVANSNGDDLLATDNVNGYNNHSKIKVLYMLNGKLVNIPNGSDYPGNFLIYEQDGHSVARFFLYDSGEKYSETHIIWDETHTDVIKAEFERTKNSTTKKRIWLNDQLVTDIQPYLKIVK